MRLFWRVFLANAVVLAGATIVLAVSPATVSFPIGPIQAAVLVVGLAAMLGLNLLVLRRAFTAFERLVAFARTVDPLTPGARVNAQGAGDVRDLERALNDMLDRLETERREFGQRLVAGQEDERRRISRELHDEVGQLLTAALLQLDHAIARAPATVTGPLEGAREAIDATHQFVREISRRLRPVALDDLGLPSALAALARVLERSGGAVIQQRLEGEGLPELTQMEELVIYRVAQEALTNALRHGRPSTIDLAMAVEGGAVVLRVADDGSGMSGAVQGNGIRGMRERAVLAGGRLDITPRGGGGTVVTLTLPKPDGAQHPLAADAPGHSL